MCVYSHYYHTAVFRSVRLQHAEEMYAKNPSSNATQRKTNAQLRTFFLFNHFFIIMVTAAAVVRVINTSYIYRCIIERKFVCLCMCNLPKFLPKATS